MASLTIKLSDYKVLLTFACLMGLASAVFFFRLDQPALRTWDEARLAVNALEMAGKYAEVTKAAGWPAEVIHLAGPLVRVTAKEA